MSEPEVLAALRASGAEVFDPPAFGLVRSLLARAEALPDGARARLLERARERAELLRGAVEAARAAARGELAALAEAGASVAPELDLALGRGEVAAVRRAARRARRELSRRHERVEVPWMTRLHERALSRGAAVPDEVTRGLAQLTEGRGEVDRGAHGRAVALGSAVSSALLSSSAESVRATIAVARVADNLPDAPGPYNGQVLAARALTAMAELSPAYVQAIVAAVDDLAGMEARLPPEAARPKSKPARPLKRKRAG